MNSVVVGRVAPRGRATRKPDDGRKPGVTLSKQANIKML